MKDIIVTGAYGGMGRATVKALSDMGYRVFALDKSVEEGYGNVIPVETDIAREEEINRAVGIVSSYTNTVHAIIHFAGIYMLDSLVEIDTSDFDKIFDVNFRGVYLVNKLAFPLLKYGSRIIVTTSELAPLDPLPFTSIYAVTKSALDKYAFSLRMELQLLGISVSVLRAGAVNTGMLGVSTSALERFCNNTRLYSCNAKRFKAIVDRVEARSISSDKLAMKVVSVLKKKKPSFSYSINRNPLLLLLNLLPCRIQFFVIRLVLK